MKTFEIFRCCSVKKKFLFLLFCLTVLFITSCAKIAPPSPLRADYLELGEEGISNVSVSDIIVENRDSVGVQKFEEASWINLQFRGEIDTTSSRIVVMNLAGEEVPFTREWDISPDVTELVLKPVERLNYNTVYILKIFGTEMYKLNGEYLDINGNGVGGEVVGDDFVFPFVTIKPDDSKGDWQGITEDKIPPFVVPSLKFFIEEKSTDYVWTDSDIALYIYDYSWVAADTSIIVAAIDTASLSKDKFKIVEKSSKKEVNIKGIDYIGDPDTANFGRVIIDPTDNLEPGTFYILRILGGISDSCGNKLGVEDSIVFEKNFKTFFCNYDSTECARDTTAPVVLNWRNISPSFEISFSELIDPESVTDSSVYIPELEGELFLRNECGQTFLRFTTLKRRSLFGHTAYVTEEVSDMAGNKIREVNHYFER